MFLSNSNKTKTYYIYFDSPVTNKRTSRSCKTKLKSEANKFLQNFRFESSKKPSIDRSALKLSSVRQRIISHYKINNSINTFLSYRNTYDNLMRLIGDKYLSIINKSDIEDFKLKRSKEVSFVSVNIDIRNIKAMFNKMIEFELLEFSKISSVKQFRIEKKKMLAIDPRDINKILNSEIDTQLKQIIRFTLLTASRISEVLNVKLKDIDFENEVINIYQKKTNCFKTIPLTIGLLELVNEILSKEDDSNIYTLQDKEVFLFPNPVKNNPFLKQREDTVSKQFKKILRKLNLSEDFKFHSLRHSAITELIKNNVPLNIVKEIAGHKSITTTMIYSHVKSDDLRQAVNSLKY
ncbi:MAG: phage integrase family protein [Ignavibacteria bacterium]|nr:phage integrase family protein [Ignavibacteria bacterium]